MIRFSAVRIVIYVRPQLDHIVSLYSTVLRTGYKGSLEEFIANKMRKGFRDYFDLRGIITQWGRVFGPENIIVRPYKGTDPETGSLGDFCQVMGIDLTSGDWKMPTRANVSITAEGQNLLLKANQEDVLTPDQHRELAKWAEAHHAGQGAMPDLALAQSFQSLFQAGNAWVIQTYFPEHPEYLQPRWPID